MREPAVVKPAGIVDETKTCHACNPEKATPLRIRGAPRKARSLKLTLKLRLVA